MGRKKNIIIKQGLPGWVMTYGDMMSLLLTFFVLIVSFSSLQETKFKEAASSLKNAFGVVATPESVIPFEQPTVPADAPTDAEADILYEVRTVEKIIADMGLDKQVAVALRKDGVLFQLNAPFLFESGAAELAEEPKGVLAAMSRFFTKFPYKIEVEGHTDNIPIASAKFPSNWELSAARSVTVARYFQSVGMPPSRIAATGYGEFRPIAENDTPEGRQKNRRVEIFLHLDREDLTSKRELPFSDMPIQLDVVGPGPIETKNTTEDKGPVRPIADPVTGKLGVLPVHKSTQGAERG